MHVSRQVTVHGIVFLAVLGFVSTARATSQMFPPKHTPGAVSAYLVKPTEGMQGIPDGWEHITHKSFGNSAIADEALEAKAKDASCKTTSYILPKSDYTVSILVRGKGQARLAGTAWSDFETRRNNYYEWIQIGEAKGATSVLVELKAVGDRPLLFYGGLLAEGQVQPVNPVAEVLERLKAGKPVTVVLMGDSVTENSGGTGGGSSSFEKGNPGLMLQFLRDLCGEDVDYFTHRLPVNWPQDRELSEIPTVEMDGKSVYDSRIETDASKRVHLINLAKGGAAAPYGWTRLPDTIVEYDYFDHKFVAKDQRKHSVRFGLTHYRPDLIIINFGTNDVNGAHPNWLVEDYLFHMRVMATNFQRLFGCAVILSTPHKWTSGVHLLTHRQPQMVDALREYCGKTGIALADVYNEYAAGEYEGIHPRDLGHKHMADAYIKTVLGQPSASAIEARITAEQLKDNGDSTVTDVTTGLVWTKSADLAAGGKTLDETVSFADTFNREKQLGHGDWRLPTREELLGVVDPAMRRPALPEGHAFSGVSGWYRSSTEGWGVDMDAGTPWGTGKSAGKAARIWLVRGGEEHAE